MPRPPLLLDGFISPKAAESRMHDFYPDWSEKTLGRMTTFITIKNLLKLRGNQQKLITTQSLPLKEKITLPSLRPVFFPSLAYWFNFNGGNVSEWFQYLEYHQLADKKVIDRTAEFLKVWGHNQDWDNPSRFRDLLRPGTTRNREFYNEVVLLKAPSIY